MRVLIIGATGLLGKALLEEWHFDPIIGVGSRDADIRDPQQLRQLFTRCQPDWTVLAAAYTDVDGCEKNPDRAHQVNCVGAIHVARAAREARSRLLFLSTDYVFDGSKRTPYEAHDPVRPINAYGRSKAEVEKELAEIFPDCCIVRTSWLFGAHGKCFPNTILEMAQSQKELFVVADQTGSPTFNRDLARTIVQLVRANAQGTIHATNAGECTWYEFASGVLRTAGRADVRIEPIRSEDLARPAARPKYSVLSNTSLEGYGVRMRPWRETISEYLADRRRTSCGMSHSFRTRTTTT